MQDIEHLLNYFDANKPIENNWFKENVVFVFSKGYIFDKDDEEQLDNVLNTFVDNHRMKYLGNIYEVRDYEDKLIQNIEEKLAIGNGNYHILLVTVVLKHANLEEAPEKCYQRIGLIEKYVSWSAINDLITDSLSKYGISGIPIIDKLESSNPKVPKEIAFDINGEMKDEEFKIELSNDYPNRARNIDIQRKCRLVKHPSLQTRINDPTIDSIVDKTTDHKDFIEFKTDCRVAPPEVIHTTFELHEDAERMKIPTFKQTDIRSRKTRMINGQSLIGLSTGKSN